MPKFYTPDYGMSCFKLDDKYNPDGDGEHPGYTRRKWRDDVKCEQTLAGYWDWVVFSLECEQDELDKDNLYTANMVFPEISFPPSRV